MEENNNKGIKKSNTQCQSKSWFFETVSEIDKLLAKVAKMKRERPILIKLERRKRLKQTPVKSRTSIKECFENIYSKKLEKSKRNKFLYGYIYQN